jgi:two-component system, OmpR family, copper resistance phosphate regulon response regulator CusR
MARLLVVEDEPRVLRSMEDGLRDAGFEVETATTGDQGARMATTRSFDCIVLDWMLPGRDGLQILADLRKSGRSTPTLLLTARDAIEDRVLGLETGADDYLIKPFAFAELLARLRVLLRRGRVEPETVLRTGDNLELDLLRRRATRDGVEVVLAHREFEVLEYLVRHKNEPVTREMLGTDVWKEPSYALTNVIEVYINLLRKKVEIAGRSPRIVTLRGVGYSLRE